MPVQRSRLRITNRGLTVVWVLMYATLAVLFWVSAQPLG